MSNWEQGKQRSNYHFDKWKMDADAVEHLGYFTGDWQDELKTIVNDAKPLTWGNRREGTGRIDGDVEAEEYDLIKAGANPDTTIYRGLKDFTKCPTLQKMTDFFALKPVFPKLHIQFTGEVLNMHIDKLHDLDPNPENILRIMVMLEDWEPGQFLMYGNQTFDRWRAGSIHKFDWQNLPHGTANASNIPRPMLVITGVITDTTRNLLKKEIMTSI